jgi:hypothetical protein
MLLGVMLFRVILYREFLFGVMLCRVMFGVMFGKCCLG